MVETDILPALQRAADWLVDSPLNAVFALVVAVVVAHVIPFITATHAISYPGPLLAKFSDFWLVRQAQKGKRFVVVHELHQKHGKFVRLAPNHISIADHRALNAVYGHGTGTMKSEYYDAFVPPRPAVRGVFNTRDRQEHSRKRRIVAHSFAPKSIISFEEFIRREVALLLERWDEFCDKAKKEGTKGPRGLVGYAWLDSLLWLNYFAFDTIGTLAFGKTFGMLENGKDEASVDVDDGKGGFVTSTCSAVETINLRGEVSSTLGLVPVWLRPLVLKHPWFSHRLRAVKTLTGIALARVNDRLENGSERDDLLAKLQAATDDSGQPMGKAELTAEALTQLIAGSDTTSNTACAILHHLGTTPRAMKKLQEELDRELLDKEIVDESGVPRMDDVNELPYLQAVLSESLRYHSTSSLGLPRILPPQGATICGRFFPGGSVLSVPAYTIHRDAEVWGKDAEEYNPDRWLPEGARKEFDKAFVPFSVGPRACVGRNVAMAELSILIAAIIMRYDIVLESPEKPLEKVEGFLVKPTELQIGLKRRH
ncbi:putative benzoate 4-monooxygenase cytochrome P450 [Tilletiopsis washingtonensis]|uniref:Putative benzoate 4-monooxygenase cytochrome P450 n=1 Tax=Tilletiopsis washingtonensis TaxID=58919 RepID=A0A316Z3P5_9BASI|nr:putative benzoate 4-monooxygenase cytochrome P450 [Tilletiopsis washingtonensis]PWN96219.1 putative benzoate 4-monooxygenase cytochrome P450 [Tilletiopsis washingtonensis]